MKTITAIIAAFCVSTHWTNAQTTSSSPYGSSVNTGQAGLSDAHYSVTDQGPDYRVWQQVIQATDKQGKLTSLVKPAYVELATGMQYQNNCQWLESKEEIQIMPDGTAAAVQGPHQAYFPGDIYRGNIKLVTPDGKVFISRPLGLSYFDGTNNVLIAELKDSVGELVGSNQVVYPDAFTDFRADLCYTYTKSGFEQDIILREQPPAPEGFGLALETTRLQVLTEFFNPPQPVKRNRLLPQPFGVRLNDESLDFGVMKIGAGKAFAFGAQPDQDESVAVAKSWLLLDGRQFLVEELPISVIAEQLDGLPLPAQVNLTAPAKSVRHTVSNGRLLPARRMAWVGDTNQIKSATLDISRRGFVLDYVTVNSSLTNYTFQGDTTYYISGPVVLFGTNTFEGGTVIKYAPTNSASVTCSGAINSPGSAYKPAVFTARDDNSVGETIAGSTGNPTNYYAAIELRLNGGTGVAMQNLRFSFAQTALALSGSSSNVFSHVQMVSCQNGINATNAVFSLRNALFWNVRTNFAGNGSTGAVEQLTVDTAGWLNNNLTLSLTNCLLVAVTNTGTFTSNSVSITNNSAGVFLVAGAGAHYLAANSLYRNIGTPNINPALLGALHKMTTYPPVIYSNITIAVATNFTPQAQRDTDTPDLGYHYDPIDYIADSLTITNAALTVTNGAVIANYNRNGIQLQTGSSIVSMGSPLAPNRFVRYQAVQELSITLGSNAPAAALSINPNHPGSTGPAGTFRFTQFICPAAGGSHLFNASSTNYNSLLVQDCEFWGGQNYLSGSTNTTTTFKNNLFYRSAITAAATNLSSVLNLTNNLVFGALVNVLQPTNKVWSAFNNDFDTCTITNSTLTNGYNAYLNCSGRLQPTNVNDRVQTSGLSYQTGPLGAFYQPAGSLLIDKGNLTANLLGLYHYTTQTNQMKETNSIVDIGYHYVATDTNGIPLDSNNDGIPDYLEDANGNGLVDNGETNWGLAILTQPATQTVPQGTNVTFTVTAAGINPLSYQWYFNGTNLVGATSASLSLTNVQVANQGSYFVVVTNVMGSLTSSVAILALTCDASPSGLVAWWQAQSNALDSVGTNNGSVSSSGVTYGPGKVGLAFNFDGTNGMVTVPDSPVLQPTNFTIEAWIRFASLNSKIVGSAWPGEQFVINRNGQTDSSYFLGKQRTNNYDSFTNEHLLFGITSVTNGQTARAWIDYTNTIQTNLWYHMVAVRGSNYIQLYINGQFIGSSNANFAQNYVSNPVIFGSSGNASWDGRFYGTLDELSLYNRALSSNEIAQLYNAGSAGKCALPPSIVTQPTNQLATVGGAATFVVVATGSQPLSYQWWFNATNLLAGATNTSLTLTNVQTTNAGNYSVVVANVAGSVTSSNAVLTMNGPPVITQQPVNVTTNMGSTATFIVIATGTPNPNYQWRFNTTNILAGATNSSLSLTNVQTTNAGSYSVVVTNVSGSVTSSNAVLTVNVPPIIIQQPFNVMTNVGGSATFSVTVSNISTLPLSYQWWFNTTNILAGATNSSLTLTNVQTTNAGSYSVVVTNVAGNATSSNAVLTVNVPPIIIQQPFNVTTNVGGNAAFSVTVSNISTLPLSYQWRFNTTNILAGATNSSLTLTNVQMTNAGNYSVVVTNVEGSVTSSNALLTVNVPPIIIQQPLNVTTNVGGSATFSVTVSNISTLPLSYQWRFNTTNFLAGATNVSLTLTNVQTTNAGSYSVTVTNVAGSVTSSNASLIVNNTLPTVQIVSPVNQVLLVRSNVMISATATNAAPGVTISWVELFVNGTGLGFVTVQTNGVYQYNWLPPLSGTNILTALAMDSRGSSAWSSPVTNYVRNLPIVTFVFPTNGQVFPASPTNTVIQVTATADRASITNVVFYQGTNILGSTNAGSPYTINWNNVTNGNYTLHVLATDSTGLGGISSNIVVTFEPTNRPPSVFLGSGQTNYLSTNSVLLSGIVSDDGLPYGSTLTVAWTNLSGGGGVTFVNSNVPVTSAYFSATGIYVLQLSANDSQYITRSNFTMTILPANQPPHVNAGTNQTLILPAIPSGIPVPTIQLSPITNITGTIGLDYFPPSNCLVASFGVEWGGSPDTFFLLSSNGLAQKFTSIRNIDYEPNIATVKNTLGGFKVGEMFCGNWNPGGIMRIEPDGTTVGTNIWKDSTRNTNHNAWLILPNCSQNIAAVYVDRTGVWGGDLIATALDGEVWRIDSAGQATLVAQLPSGDNHDGLLTVPDDTQKYGPWAGRILSGGGNLPGYLYAIDTNGVAVYYNMPFAAEDILVIPDNENFFGVDSGWRGSSGQIYGASASQFQGMAGDILFAEECSPAGGGSPIGRLYRVHWNGTNFDSYPLTFPQYAWEQAAFAPAGLYDMPLAGNIQLQGVVTDDGELWGSTSNYWSLVSGPGSVTFGNPAQTNTTVEFSTNGDYVLQLRAFDGQYTSSNNVTIHVIRNQAPVVSAGANQVIGTNTTTLTGSVTDDGLPFGITNVTWSVVSVPPYGNATVYSPTNLTTRIDFQVPGAYELRLTANDGQASSSADVIVSVQSPLLTLTPGYGIATRTNVVRTIIAHVEYTNHMAIQNASITCQISSPGGTTINTNVWTDANGNATLCYSTNLNSQASHRDIISATASVNSYPSVTTLATNDWGQNVNCWDTFLSQPLGAGGSLSREWTPEGYVDMRADFYIFTGSAGDLVGFSTVQHTTALMMILRDPSDQIINWNLPLFYKDTANFLYQQLPASGDYVLEVVSIFSGQTDNYDFYSGCFNNLPSPPPKMQVLYNGTNVPNGGTIVFPPTSHGMATNLSLVVTNAGGQPFDIVGMGTNGDFAFSNYIWGAQIQGGTSTNLGIIFNANTNGLNFGAMALATNNLGSNYIVYFMANTFPTGAVPTVQLTSPTNDSSYFYNNRPVFNEAIPFAATVTPGSASITSVQLELLTTNGIDPYFHNAYYQLILDSENLTYTNTFNCWPLLGQHGDYTISASAADQNNQSGMAPPVLIHVLAYTPPPTELPGIEVLYQGTNIPNGGSIAFPQTTAGVPTNITLIITNNGVYPLGIQDLELDGDFTFTNETLSDFVPVGGSMQLGIVFNAPSNVVNVGQLLIDNNASSGGPYTVALIGSAYPPGYIPTSGTNLPPVAANYQFTVEADSVNNVLNPLVNDYDTNGDALTIVDVTPSQGGNIEIINNGTAISYTPPLGIASDTINGVAYPADGFTYKISDGHGGTAWGVVSIILDASGIPQVNFTSPPSGYTTNAGAVVPITVNVTPPDNIVKVDFYLGGNVIGEVTNGVNGAYTLNWTATFEACNCGITASATDKFNQVGVAQQPIHINVTVPPGVHAPTAGLMSFTGSTGTNMLLNGTNNVLQEGLIKLYGLAYQDQGSNVTWQLKVYTPDGTLVHSLTSGTNSVVTTNTPLAICDLTALMNGVYDLRLTVTSAYMETNTDIPFRLESNLKIGQFSFSQQDLVIPVNGIPLTVTRTYNSINPAKGDFGYGWTYALNSMNVSIDETREDVADLDGNVFSQRNGGSWDVTLTLPNGQTTTFYFYLNPLGNGIFEAKWQLPPGVVGVKDFVAQGDNRLQTLIGGLNGNSDLFYWEATGPGTPMNDFDFPGFILTMQDGTQYFINGDNQDEHFVLDGEGGYYIHAYGPPKLGQIVQRTHDTITINADSIVYTASNSVQRKISIQRDPDSGLIVSIGDPNGASGGPPAVKYEYDANENLIDVQNLVDRNAGSYVTNFFTYTNASFPHYITGIINANNAQVARNFYDDSGKLVAVQDANGQLTQFIHNTANNMEVVIDRMGHTNTYVYDLRGNVIVRTNALGQVTTMAYDANNNKTNDIVFLSNGQPYATNSYIYDTNLNVMLSSTDPLGHTNGFTYDPTYGLLLTNADAFGHVTANIYDPNTGNLISTTDALGHGTTNSYSSASLLTGSCDALGTITTNYYDGANNLIATATLDVSHVILSSNTFAYDANVNRTNSTIWRRVGGVWTPATTTYIYDAMNRVVQTIDPDGGTNTVVFDPTGKQQAAIDKLGRTTVYTYDVLGRLVETTYPDGTSESSVYDANGNRYASMDRTNRVTTYIYDALNRLTQTIYPDNTTNITVYDDLGRVGRTIDARGTVTAFNYDVAGRRLAVTNAFGTSVAVTNIYGYDVNGNQITFADSLGHTTTNVFDALNRQVQVKYANGTTNFTGYDAAGRRVAETNQDSIVTLFGYDGAGRLTSVTNAANTAQQMVARYQYDEAGNEIAQVDALNRTNTFAYDGMGRRILHTRPDNQYEGFTYDLAGNQVARTNFFGYTLFSQYDALNRLTNSTDDRTYGTIYTYTATGQRQSMNTWYNTTVTYNYDKRDRLVQKVVTFDNGFLASLNYNYDANGNVIGLLSGMANGVNLAYGYDPLNRLTNVLSRGQLAASYQYDTVGNLQGMRYGNGVTNFYQYDSLNRLTNLTWKYNNASRASFYYQLGLSGNRTNLAETINAQPVTGYAWSYDRLYRLTNENISAIGYLGYQYDGVGNRTNRTSTVTQLPADGYAYDTNDELTADSNTSAYGNYMYNVDGNTANKPGTQTTYAYDSLNRLTVADQQYSTNAQFTYDGDGNRMSKAVSVYAGGNMKTYFLVDDRNPSGFPQVMEEYQSLGYQPVFLNRIYNYGLALLSEQQVDTNTLLPSTLSYYGYDGHGSVRFLTDTNGAITDTYTYDAYGTLIASTGSTPNNYLYAGQQWDPETGFYYNRARYLNPDLGRFWTMDTYAGNNEDPLSLHKYLYCQGNPVDNDDPSGHDIGEMLSVMSISAGLDAFHFNFSTTSILGGGLPVKTLNDADIDSELNHVYNKIRGWEKLHGPVPDEPHKLWISMMKGNTVDTIWRGTAEKNYLYQYNGTEHPWLLNRTFINSDINYIGFGEGCCARGWNEFEMQAGIDWHLWHDFQPAKYASENTYAAAFAGWRWAVPKFYPNPRRH